MNIRNCIGVTWKDLYIKKKHALHLFLDFLVLETVLIVWLVLSSSLNNAQNQYIYENISMNNVNAKWPIEVSDDDTRKQRELLTETMSMEECDSSYVIWDELDLVSYMEKENWVFVNCEFVSLRMGSERYQGVNDCSYFFDKEYSPYENQYEYSVPFRVGIYDSEELFTINELLEYQHRYQDATENGLLLGRLPQAENEILLSDYYLERFGLCKEDVLDQCIDIIIDDTKILQDVTITGVIDSRIYMDMNFYEHPQVWIKGYPEQYSRFGVTDMNLKVPIKRFQDSISVNNALITKDYEVEVTAISEAMRFAFLESAQRVVDKMVSLFGAVVFLAILFNLVYVIFQDMKERTYYYGMLRANGITTGKLAVCSLVGKFPIVFVSAVIAFLLAREVLSLLSYLLEANVGIKLSMSLYEYLPLTAGGAAGVMILVFLLELPIIHWFGRRSIVELLNAGN